MTDSVTPAENTGEPEDPWTPADFLDKAHVLKRRLAVWHIENTREPVWVPCFLKCQEAIRFRFRDVCFKGEHGPKTESGTQLFPGVASIEASEQGYVGTAYRNLPTDVDKHLTRWLLRDFFLHLPNAGEGERAKYLRRIVDRILDAPVYRRRAANDVERHWVQERDQNDPNGAPHALIGGHPVDESLLDQLVFAAESLWTRRDSSAVESGNAAVINRPMADPVAAAMDAKGDKVNGDPPESDGPVQPDRWRHNGEIVLGKLPTKAFALVAYLWECKDRSATIDELARPVFGDDEKFVDIELVRGHTKAASKFFRDANIPLKVQTKKNPEPRTTIVPTG